MADLVRLPIRSRSDHEAAEWLARLDRGLTPDEQSRLHEWLRADVKHAEQLLEVAALWDDLDVLSELSALLPLERPEPPRIARRRFAWAAAAGAFAVVAFAGGLLVHQHTVEHVEPVPAPQTLALAFETSIGERATEQLPDGSVVTLNTSTSIRIEYSAGARDVFIERGEAFFDVADEPRRPFRVHAGGSVVEAVGTAFNVKLAARGDVEITVTEGRVKVRDRVPASPAASPERRSDFDTTLIEGEVAVVDRAERVRDAMPKITRLEPAQLDMKLAWQRGMLIFEGEPLEAMLEEVERYTTADFVVADEQLRGIRIGGYFRAGDVDALLVALRENFDIESERLGERIVLRAVL